MTQASCAGRAGMTPQQWNQIEKQVRQPNAETVRRVASGLMVSDNEALRAAGYDTDSAPLDVRLARRLEPVLMLAHPDERPRLEAALEQVARAMVGAPAH